MLSRLKQKPRQKNEGQKNGICYHQNIFLSSIFLSFKNFCGMFCHVDQNKQ